MPHRTLAVFGLCLIVPAHAETPAEQSVEQIAQHYRKSVVVVSASGRDGKRHGLGTGFVVSADGLIATNLHVIGEGRAVAVELADGRTYDVVAVHATERAADLAVVRIIAKDLPALDLGDSDKLEDGQPVVGLGNPQGLKHSVVGGVVSGKRIIDGRAMIQLAIPMEPGNSGGPLLDRFGRAQGILTMKSAVTENLGFAMPINALKPLLGKPHPVPMEKWLTIGALDPEEWTVVFGARWRQRAGRILVDGAGQGFGGRALCLATKTLPALPCEIAVTVKLNDEAGAAGLVFHADGSDKHYGFYPSNGELRLTRFDGPDVFSWKILAQKPSEHYRPGEWNTLKVRLEKNSVQCFVNDHLVVESDDAVYTSGKAGLAKFRDTGAEFKRFQIAKAINGPAPAAEGVKALVDKLPAERDPPAVAIDALSTDAPASLTLLRERARALDRQAARLRQTAALVHQKQVRTELARALNQDEDKIDLAHAALLVALLDNDEIDVPGYRDEIERMGKKLAAGLPKDADEKARLAALNNFLFEERGFHGSRGDYYHRSNSYLNEVIDDREGLPITLAILYMELGRRIGLKLEGVGLPGHFVVRHVPDKGEPQLIDVFEGGTPLSRADARRKVESTTGMALTDEQLKAVPKRQIIVRVLHNLLSLTGAQRDAESALRYLDPIIELTPDAGRERWMRAVLSFQTGKKAVAARDVDWLLDHAPAGVNLREVKELKRMLNKE
jgi:regulator of sirC expression with transglutaminase-like and TPR domain